MRLWFRVPALDPHMTFPTVSAAQAAMRAAGITAPVIRYRDTGAGVIAQPVTR